MFLNESLQRIQEICQYKKGQRPQSEIEWLASATKTIKVFNDIILSQGYTGYYSVCQYLNYEYFAANDCLFKYGDVASKFYVILEGKISIQVPIPNTTDFQEVATFESGSSFGELALESSKPRNASIFCKKACHFLSLEKKPYFKFIRRVITEKKEDIKDFIQNLPLFKSVSKNALFKLAFSIKEAGFVKGQTVFKEGEPAKNIFIIREGEIKLKKMIISKENTNGIRNIIKRRVYTARRYGQGGVIGDDDAINNKTYSYSCICSSDVLILYTITTREFLRRMNSNESIEYMKQRHTKKTEELNDWKNMRNSLNLVFKQQSYEKILKPKLVQTERLVRVKTSSMKKIINSRNDSRTRLDTYTNQIDSTKSFSELVKNNSYESKTKKTKWNGLAVSSMNSLPILEGLWTKKIEKYYKK